MFATKTRILVALATYNERDNLGGLVAEICAAMPDADVLIMDDGSPDGTGELADSLARGNRRIKVIHRAGKLGLGTAVLAIMQYAMDSHYQLLITMDADFSHHPRYLPDLVGGMDRADVMIGSRYVPGGGVENWPRSRQFMSRAANGLVRLLLHMPIRDASGNYRCYRVATLRQANLDNLVSTGYSFLEEVLHRCHLAGCRFGETPIVFVERRAGRSKADLREMIRSFSGLLRLGWRARFRQASMMPVHQEPMPIKKAG
jgi:dolichol-phosphate mannosyltransferase